MSDIAIKVENLTKVYHLYDSPRARFKEALHPFRKKFHHDFYAVNDVSFEIKRGETVGIIGQNGSGKSTLLKMITGVLTPTSGSIQVNGRISSLLELGTGFNPDMTGMENIFFYGTINGMTHEQMAEKVDEIVAFADIGEFIHQPVKTYSSGMFVRLAFAAAVHIEPDILIVDEALSVGDASFQAKSFERIQKLMNNGATLLFVSHDPGAVKRLCHRAILLANGKVAKEGNPEETFDLYNAMLADPGLKNTVLHELESGKVQTVSGTGEARVKEIFFLNEKREQSDVLEVGTEVTLVVKVAVYKDLPKLVMGFMIKDRMGQVMFGTNTFHTGQILEEVKRGSEYEFYISMPMNLGPANYSVSVALTLSDTHLEKNYEWRDYALFFKVVNVFQYIFTGFNFIRTNIEFNEKKLA